MIFNVHLLYTCRYGSILIVNCEILSGDVIIVMLSAINGSLALGNALPDLGALAAAVGSATLVFEIIDRVNNLVKRFTMK